MIHKISCVCNLVYIGETSDELHLRINQHRPDAYKFSPPLNCFKSTVELQHFNLHDFKTRNIEILNIKRNLNGHLFLKLSYRRFFNIIYSHDLDSEVF